MPAVCAGPAPGRALRAAGLVEALSLLVLLANLATVHLPGLAAGLGPLHGSAYLAGIALAWTGGCPRHAWLLALVPGIGALLADRAARAARAATGTSTSTSTSTSTPT